MDSGHLPEDMQPETFGIGQPVRRKEDIRFITGRGRYTDDVNLDGQAYACILRSPHSHAEIRSIDTTAAKAAPGVVAVLTGEDAEADGVQRLPVQVDVPARSEEKKMYAPLRPILALGRVRFVGDPVALVIAESYEAARDAAELIEVDYADLPAVADTAAAAEPGAPLVWPERGSNLCVHWESGPPEPAADAFARAAKVVSVDLINNRVVPAPMEPRVALAVHDPEKDQTTLYSPTQGAVKVRKNLAELAFKLPLEKMRVVSYDTGGGFGARGKLFPESVMVVWAARRLGRPVKWRADRMETMIADAHGRDHVTHAELALDAGGRILAMRQESIANVGAYLSDFGPRIPTFAGARIAGTVYDVPALYLSVRVVFTNTVPTDAYRGAGRPETCYVMERLLDAAAEAFGTTRTEIRERNFIKPASLPYKNAVGMVIDSGEFEATQAQGLALADWDGFEARRQQSASRGKRRGIGLGYYIEASGGMPTEQARVILEPNGDLKMIVGTFNHGQGHETAFAQIVNDRLGVPFDKVTLMQGDTDFVSEGNGTGGSRSSQMGGVSILRACNQVVEKGKAIAGHMLEAATADIEFDAGSFRVVGTDRTVTLAEVAGAAADPARLPEGMAPGLDETCLYKRPTECNFPNGIHVAEVEIDPDTGVVTVVRYTAVDDCGVVINPLLVHGQVHGGVAMGLGQALLEHTAYDPDSAQFLSASFMDYGMPRADNFPDMAVGFNPVRNPSNDLGVKGAGEGGACGAPPAIVGAVADALKDLGIRHLDMPLTPEKVWRAMRAAEGRAA